MIDRYTIYSSTEALAGRFDLETEREHAEEFNAAPTKMLPVVADSARGGLSFFYWGAASRWSNNKSISRRLVVAEKEQILAKNSLANMVTKRRCLIPANGFYLWKQVGKKSKRPYYFTLNDREIFSFAGIWEDYDDMEGKVYHTFRMITTTNHLEMPEFGEHVPVILSEDAEKLWLNDDNNIERLVDLLTPLTQSVGLTFHCVSPHIADLKNNYQELIKPQPPVDQSGNYTLFE